MEETLLRLFVRLLEPVLQHLFGNVFTLQSDRGGVQRGTGERRGRRSRAHLGESRHRGRAVLTVVVRHDFFQIDAERGAIGMQHVVFHRQRVTVLINHLIVERFIESLAITYIFNTRQLNGNGADILRTEGRDQRRGGIGSLFVLS
ncbi:hypothetical protein D3C72_1559690 [compost metagenome]